MDVTGRGGSELALAVEAAENNVRRQYTAAEIVALAERFKAAGYKTTSGKPKEGEKTVLGALEVAVGRSKRQIQRILSGETKSKKSDWEQAKTALRKAAEKVVRVGDKSKAADVEGVVAAAKKVAKAMEG